MNEHNLIDQIKDLIFDTENIAWIGSADGKLAMSWEEFDCRF